MVVWPAVSLCLTLMLAAHGVTAEPAQAPAAATMLGAAAPAPLALALNPDYNETAEAECNAVGGFYTPGHYWIRTYIHLVNVSDDIRQDPNYPKLVQAAVDVVSGSAANATGIQYGLLQDSVIFNTLDAVEAMILLDLANNTSVLATMEVLDEWQANLSAGFAPGNLVPADNADDGHAFGFDISADQGTELPPGTAGAVAAVDSFTMVQCIPKEFVTLIESASQLLANSTDAAMGSSVSSEDCIPSNQTWIILNYALKEVLSAASNASSASTLPNSTATAANAPGSGDGSPAVDSTVTTMLESDARAVAGAEDVATAVQAAEDAGYQIVTVPASDLDGDILTSLMMDAQRYLAFLFASYETSPYGLAWQARPSGGVGSFALPLNASRLDSSSIWLFREVLRDPLSVSAPNTAGQAFLTGLALSNCTPAYFEETTAITDKPLYNNQSCGINADGSLPTPFFSNTPNWFATINGTITSFDDAATYNRSIKAVQEALNDLTDKAAVTLQVLAVGSDAPSQSRPTAFMWPTNRVNGQLKVSAQVLLAAGEPNQDVLSNAYTTLNSLGASTMQFEWGSAQLSNISFTPCSPMWFMFGRQLATAGASAGASAPTPAPPAPAADGSSKGTSAAAIAVPVALGCTLLLIIVVGVLWRRRRQRTGAQVLLHARSSSHTLQGGTAGLDDTWLIPYSEIETTQSLGEGTYGVVYKARWKDTAVAVKALIPPPAQASGSTGTCASVPGGDAPHGMVAAMQKEAAIMSGIRHPNCIMYLGAVLEPPCLVMELASRGSLLEVLHKANLPFPWPRRINMAFDAAKGMQYLHSRQPPIIHRDLKSPNLLVGAHWQVKVSDFGLSRVLQEQNSVVSSLGGPGNPRWLAPEVLRGDDSTAASDVYSFAIILWELLCQGQLPWQELGTWKIASAVRDGERPAVPNPEECPGFAAYDAYVQLMRDCWQQDPALRPTFDEVCAQLRSILGLTMKKSSKGTDKPPSVTERLRRVLTAGKVDAEASTERDEELGS